MGTEQDRPSRRARPDTTDSLLDLAYGAREIVGLLRELHDPRVDPRTYARALIDALRELEEADAGVA